MIKEITEVNFPSYATLCQATVTLKEMGDRTITSTLKIDGSVVPDFSYDWEVRFKGERFIHPTRTPQASKGNESLYSSVDITFHHWAIYQLKRYYFMEMTSVGAGTAIADKYEASLGLTIRDFVIAFNNVLEYYFGDKIQMRLNPNGDYSNEPKYMNISYSYIWDVLQELYEVYDVRWKLEYDESLDVYFISVGYTEAAELDHIFEYGYEGGLLKFERSVQNTEIKNVLLGRGGEENLPCWYFKNPELFVEGAENDGFLPDPDAIPELRFVTFTELRGWTFRMYVRGWMTNNHRIKTLYKNDGSVLWSVGTLPSRNQSLYLSNWAYAKGCDDTKFDPPEYVRSEPSIEKYGEIWGSLENNTDIVPSIQGVSVSPYGRIDEIVAVEEVTTDDITSMTSASITIDLPSIEQSETIHSGAQRTITSSKTETFTVPNGVTGSLTCVWFMVYGKDGRYSEASADVLYNDECKLWYKGEDGVKNYSVTAIPPGTYQYGWDMYVRIYTQPSRIVTLGAQSVKLLTSDTGNDAWKPTFDIWVKNIWETSKQADETDEDYVIRVWGQVLGSRVGGEASVVFATGWLSGHENWDFAMLGPTCLDAVHYDTSKSYHDVQSEWRITIQKTDAELTVTNKYIPYVGFNAHAGDYFYFIGIDMPYSYVYWAEQRLDSYKTEQLAEMANISPTWTVTLDKVRTNINDATYGGRLVDLLRTGKLVNIRDKRFTDDDTYQLYIESLTYTWDGNSDIPNVEMVLAEKIYAIKSTSERLSGEVQILRQQVSSINAIEDTIATVASRKFLAKSAQKDVSYTETAFAAPIGSDDFVQGRTGGSGWGVYSDNEKDSTFEIDNLIVRRKLDVNEIIVNQISAIGGKQIISSAAMECSAVEETDTTYKCYFDQKKGSVANHFAVDDIVMGQRFDMGTTESKYYRYTVTEVGQNYIVLSKGNSVYDAPQEGDTIVQFGNSSDSSRQGAHIISAYGQDSPSWVVYAGINSDDETGKDVFGMRFINGEPFFFNYGSMLIGDRNENNGYIKYNSTTKVLKVAADVHFLPGSSGLNDVVEWVQLSSKVDNIQAQIDGAIETWYMEGAPTLLNSPASDWTDNATKDQHIGDLYYDKLTGKAYRFMLDNEGGSYLWVQLTDEDISAALGKANEALDAASNIQSIVGTTIVGVDVEYAISHSPTVQPTTGWSTTAPQRLRGQYLWQRVAEYKPGSTEPTYSGYSCISGIDGESGANGNYVEFRYARHNSATSAPYFPTGSVRYLRNINSYGFYTTRPSTTSSYPYIWKTSAEINGADNTVWDGWQDPWLDTPLNGHDGQDGEDGHSPYIGANGNWYFWDTSLNRYVDSSLSAQGDDGHSPYIDEDTETWWEWDAANNRYHNTGIKAEGVEGVGIASVVELYMLTTATSVTKPTSNVTQSGKVTGVWTRSCPDWQPGYTYFTCTQITYTDGTITWSTPFESTDIKNHTFYTPDVNGHPIPPYSVGDYWVCTKYGNYENEMLVCINSRAKGASFNASDWTRVGDYARDTDYEYLRNALPKTEAIQSGGLILGTLIGVFNSSNNVIAGINGSNLGMDNTHGKLLIFGGATSAQSLSSAATRIYEDGHIVCNSGEFKEDVIIKGTLQGVTGSFRSLSCINNSGTLTGNISFGSEGGIYFNSTDLYQQGNINSRSLRYFAQSVFVRDQFGAKRRTVLEVYTNYGYFYPDGVDNTSTRVYTIFTSRTSNGNTYYELPLTGATVTNAAAGMPIDIVMFHGTRSSGTEKYELLMAESQRVLLINANDYYNNVAIYSQGVLLTLNAGCIREVVKLTLGMNPTLATNVLGRGIYSGASGDNNWH